MCVWTFCVDEGREERQHESVQQTTTQEEMFVSLQVVLYRVEYQKALV